MGGTGLSGNDFTTLYVPWSFNLFGTGGGGDEARMRPSDGATQTQRDVNSLPTPPAATGDEFEKLTRE